MDDQSKVYTFILKKSSDRGRGDGRKNLKIRNAWIVMDGIKAILKK